MLVFYMTLLLLVSISYGLHYAAITCLHKANTFHLDTLDTLNFEPTQLYLICDGFSNIQHRTNVLDMTGCLLSPAVSLLAFTFFGFIWSNKL